MIPPGQVSESRIRMIVDHRVHRRARMILKIVRALRSVSWVERSSRQFFVSREQFRLIVWVKCPVITEKVFEVAIDRIFQKMDQFRIHELVIVRDIQAANRGSVQLVAERLFQP